MLQERTYRPRHIPRRAAGSPRSSGQYSMLSVKQNSRYVWLIYLRDLPLPSKVFEAACQYRAVCLIREVVRQKGSIRKCTTCPGVWQDSKPIRYPRKYTIAGLQAENKYLKASASCPSLESLARQFSSNTACGRTQYRLLAHLLNASPCQRLQSSKTSEARVQHRHRYFN